MVDWPLVLLFVIADLARLTEQLMRESISLH
jgi:hypothetical protein